MMGALQKNIVSAGTSISLTTDLPEGDFHWLIEQGATLNLVHYLVADRICNSRVRFTLQEKSSVRYHPIIQGHGSLTISAQLHQESECTVAGAYLLHENHALCVTTVQEHIGPCAISSLIFNGIVTQRASINYRGAILIGPHATKSNALQENKTILIGDHAHALSVPSLEVKTNDVQCAHGSAVGPLSTDHIIYAQSRGLNFEQARTVLLTSFLERALAGILDERLRAEYITQMIATLIEQKE